MGMTIEEKIKTLLELYHFIKGDTHFCGYNEEKATQSLETAIETMRKYHEIEQILQRQYHNEVCEEGVNDWYDMVKSVREVLEDGNI